LVVEPRLFSHKKKKSRRYWLSLPFDYYYNMKNLGRGMNIRESVPLIFFAQAQAQAQRRSLKWIKRVSIRKWGTRRAGVQTAQVFVFCFLFFVFCFLFFVFENLIISSKEIENRLNPAHTEFETIFCLLRFLFLESWDFYPFCLIPKK
jgi:hypothetical protein